MTALPVPRTWSPGLLSTGDLNIEMRDSLAYLLAPPMATVRKERAPQTLTPSVPNMGIIEWDMVVADTEGGWQATADNAYTVQVPGLYHVIAQFQAAAETDVGLFVSRVFYVSKNFAPIWGNGTWQAMLLQNPPGSSSYSRSYLLTTVIGAVAGDTLSIHGFPRSTQNTPNFDIVGYDGVNNFGCQWDLRWVSKL
ncbi:hypothetical protein [Nonomuraea sp. NPDC023979]|uniref:hypothetical protein n=1 Tax=Nonomuraea sp. NPDC023979 TaxID=3154796 RepID=UPI0033D4EA54